MTYLIGNLNYCAFYYCSIFRRHHAICKELGRATVRCQSFKVNTYIKGLYFSFTMFECMLYWINGPKKFNKHTSAELEYIYTFWT